MVFSSCERPNLTTIKKAYLQLYIMLFDGTRDKILNQMTASPWARMPVTCECCGLSRKGLCVGLITRPEESYRVWCAWMCSRSFENESGGMTASIST
jgi:hypothetical protein